MVLSHTNSLPRLLSPFICLFYRPITKVTCCYGNGSYHITTIVCNWYQGLVSNLSSILRDPPHLLSSRLLIVKLLWYRPLQELKMNSNWAWGFQWTIFEPKGVAMARSKHSPEQLFSVRSWIGLIHHTPSVGNRTICDLGVVMTADCTSCILFIAQPQCASWERNRLHSEPSWISWAYSKMW